jgi:predicted phage-related endonuclease
MTAPTSKAVPNRRAGIGASEVGSILGVNPWTTPAEVWLDKMGLLPERQANIRMALGHAVEPLVVRTVSDLLGLKFRRNFSPRPHATAPLFATPDATCGSWGLEAKTGNAPWAELPEYVRLQAIAQLACWPRLERVTVARLSFMDGDVQTWDVMRDQAEIDGVVDAVTAWWRDHVVAGVQPTEPLFLVTGPAVNATAEQEAAFAALKEARARKEADEALVEALRSRLEALCASQNVTGAGWSATWTQRRSTQWKAVAEALSPAQAIVDAYTTAKPVFTVRGA